MFYQAILAEVESGKKAKDKRQKTKDKRQKAEGRRQKAEGCIIIHKSTFSPF